MESPAIKIRDLTPSGCLKDHLFVLTGLTGHT
jgi:hypothetical protein